MCAHNIRRIGPFRRRVGFHGIRDYQSCSSAGVGRWPSPHTPLDLRRHRRLPSRLSRQIRAEPKFVAALWVLMHPPRHQRACCHLTTRGSCRANNSSFQRPLHRTSVTELSLLVSHQQAGAHQDSCVDSAPQPMRSLPGLATLRRAPAMGPDHVPPAWSCTTSTAYSALALRAYCISLPIMGFAVFSSSPNVQVAPSVHAPSPHRSCTLRRIPLVNSRTSSPRPIPSCRFCLSAESATHRPAFTKPLRPRLNCSRGTNHPAKDRVRKRET